MEGDKHIIYPILYYLLTRWEVLEKRSYLAKFLVEIEIDDQFMDEELRSKYDEYKDLQATFQANHQQLEQAQQNSYNPEELKRDLKQLEQEKD